ncbi:hypothetical protein QTJ16_005678 [Diplocarpon rosae]|uniref:Meiotically up-regulated 65 protein n=1 Tax=Diplocarpon rosae TaxID=946125 RepID=A0AAD9WDV3_9HELO|nr:hypothetical protein QTJ16_005678 [Diplocarpon rosae]PBP25019.1 meiotically up-regulated 65 protein [Diplocarpon rosae]
MSLLHSSSRRPAPLSDKDYDHEINLIDHTRPESPDIARSRSAGGRTLSPGISDSSSRTCDDGRLRKHATPRKLRQELTKRRYSKYQDRRLEQGPADIGSEHDTTLGTDEQGEEEEGDGGDRGRAGEIRKVPKEAESAIDILYENQRGGFLCGMPLFSSRALGNLDPSPWTNSAQKTSATNTTNAQVPDPSWVWAWPEWHVNMEDNVDEEGWEYSFMFSKRFSWHKKTWWNSYVRRRAWIRKRVKQNMGYRASEGHMLNPDYFTIHPADERNRSQSRTSGKSLTNRYSTATLSRREIEEGIDIEDIRDIGSLMKALKLARIDREKTEAVESFIRYGGDDLYYLRDHMHDIMGMFIFQASRRLLLSHLLKIFNEASETDETGANSVDKRRLENLQAAVKHAEEEVKSLEFWSDVKDMAEKGEIKGAVDESQGWDQRWAGLDHSGPTDVISEQKLPGMDNCEDGEGNGTAILSKSTNRNGITRGDAEGEAEE